MSEPTEGLAAAALRARVASGELLARDVAAGALASAARVSDGAHGLNIFLSRDADWTRSEAGRLDATRETGGQLGELFGIPVAIKDNIATTHLPTSCGSRILDRYVSPYEATAVRRLRQAGALIVGKTNLDEFAMGSSTEHSAFGPTRNPLDPSLVPGGSSGGSAAAVAAGVVRIALGSETGGSVRQPASFCGVAGIKPTYGRVSRYGLVAFASSLDQIGVLGASVDDAALGLSVIAGHDPRDSTSAMAGTPEFRRANGSTLRGLVVGRPREYFPESLDPRIAAACDEAIEALRERGAEVRDVSLPHTELALPAYYIIAPAEASSNLARFDGVRYGLRVEGEGLRGMYEATRTKGFGDEVVRRILLGTYVLSAGYYDAYYRQATLVRQLITNDFSRVFDAGVHVLLTPTTPTPAFALGSRRDPYDMYLSDVFTVSANLAGLPAMSVPGWRVGELPVGIQIMARPFDEFRMLVVAYALEAARTVPA